MDAAMRYSPVEVIHPALGSTRLALIRCNDCGATIMVAEPDLDVLPRDVAAAADHESNPLMIHERWHELITNAVLAGHE